LALKGRIQRQRRWEERQKSENGVKVELMVERRRRANDVNNISHKYRIQEIA
jgi:hypothetical protein